MSTLFHALPIARPLRTGRRRRGFTLVELIASMAAGLIVTMAVLGLARQATATFHEEVRNSNAEGSLRIAADRLRTDLQAAAYMSSPNANDDPLQSRAANGYLTGTNIPSTDPAGPGINNIAGIHFVGGGSLSGLWPPTDVQSWSQLANNNLAPDMIEITGNMTTTDEYIGVVLEASRGAGSPNTGCVGVAVQLSDDDPSVVRLKGGTTPPPTPASILQRVRAAFMPPYADMGTAAWPPGNGSKSFAARVSDPTGRKYNFGPVCDVSVLGPTNSISIYMAGDTSVLSASTSATSGFTGFSPVSINPVQTVRWSVRRRPDPTLDINTSDPRFELAREWVALDGTVVGPGDIVADYVVDLKFAFTVLTGANAVDVSTIDFGVDSPTPAIGGATVLTANIIPPPSDPSARHPQWLRSVKFRLTVRNAVPDRDTNVPGDGGYLYRYDLADAGFARVRTLTSEIALVNQWRFF